MPKTEIKIPGECSVGSKIQRISLETHLTHPCVQQNSGIWSMRKARFNASPAEAGALTPFEERALSALPGCH